MKKLLISITLFALIGNAAFAEELLDLQKGSSRVRFFGQAAIGLTFYKNQSCYGGKGISASKSGLGGVFGSKKNISLGIPETPNVISLKDRDGILASAFYREYSVTSGEPLAILGTYEENTGRSGSSCKKIGVFFIPENGKDYEISMDLTAQTCQLKVTRLDLNESTVQLAPVEILPAENCADKKGNVQK